MFSSQLPAPKNGDDSVIGSDQKKANQAALNNYLKEKNEVTATNDVDRMFDKLIFGSVSFRDFVPSRHRNFQMEIPLPTQAEIDSCFRKTKEAFDKILAKKLVPSGTKILSNRTANESAATINVTTKRPDESDRQRTFTIVEKALDPLQLSQVKAKKAYNPVIDDVKTPIFHKADSDSSASTKLTKEERAAWNIPTAISSWKNPNGYTVSLDKRMSSTGKSKNVASYEINEKFSELSSALDAADKRAREELKERAEAKKESAEKQKKEREERLKALAYNARLERENQRKQKLEYQSKNIEKNRASNSPSTESMTREKKRRGSENEHATSLNKKNTQDRLRELAYAEGRDISEKVLLGAAKALKQNEISYDSRFYSKAAKSQARNREGTIYDNPLFVQQDISNIYKVDLDKLDSAVEKSIADEQQTNNASKKKPTTSYAGPIEFTESESIGDLKDNDKKTFGIVKK